MPKTPSGITKTMRIEALRRILQKWGRLEKAQIDERVGLALGLDGDGINGIRRSLYRDLQELVANREAEIFYFTADGRSIEEYDEDIHKNVKAQWALIGSENQVLGASALENYGASLFVAPLLKRDIKVDQASTGSALQVIHIYFNLGSDFFCIKINADAVPATLVLGRSAKKSSVPPLPELQKRFGKRASLLLVPSPGVSTTRDEKQIGHLSLEFRTADSVFVSDLGSTNGTQVSKLTMKDADLLIKRGSVLGEDTMSTTWNHMPLLQSAPVSCPSHEILDFKLPVVIQASKAFRLLIV